MQMFSGNRKPETPAPTPFKPPAPPAAAPAPAQSAAPAPAGTNGGAPIAPKQPQPAASQQTGGVLSAGVSITGSVKFRSELVIDGEVDGEIESGGKLTVGEHATIRGEIRTKSIVVRGTVEGNITATERCELQAGCTLRGDIEAPRLIVDEEATFLGSAKISTKPKSE